MTDLTQLNQELDKLRKQGMTLPNHPGRAASAMHDSLRTANSLDQAAGQELRGLERKMGRTITNENYDSPEVKRILQENASLSKAMGSKRMTSARISRAVGTGMGGDVYNAVPRFYDPLEYWDLSGLPWNVADEGHRHKLHKWLRLYYATHYLVPILVDIFTRFPLVGMQIEVKDPQLRDFYEDLFLNQLDYGEFLVKLGREFWCALPGEQVQGDASIRPIEEIKAGDQVLTHTGEIKSVLGVSSKHYEGEFVNLTPHYGLKMRYTYGHPFLLRRDGEESWVPIEDVRSNDFLFVPVDKRVILKESVSVWESLSREEWLAVPDSDEVAKMDIPEYVNWTSSVSKYRRYIQQNLDKTSLTTGSVWKRTGLGSHASPLAENHELTDEFLWFVGLYLAEGYVTKDGVQIALHVKEIEYAERVIAFAESLGLNATVRKREGTNRIVIIIYSISFGAWMRALIGTGNRNKCLPSWAMTLPPDQQAVILRGYFDGDGHYGPVRVYAASASLKISTQIERIIRRLGVVTTINEAHSTTGLGTECTWWMVGPCLADTNLFMTSLGFEPSHPERDRAFAEWDESGRGYWVKVHRADHDIYAGPVYNFEVEEDHSYVGSVATHNCVGDAYALGSFDEHLGIWEREELINPEDVVIDNFPLLGTNQLKIKPPDYLRKIAQTKVPAREYHLLITHYPELIPYLLKNEHIPISGTLLKQVANKHNDWDTHGTPILLRGLRTLLHEEKLMASQDAIAERLYSPLILAKLGIQDMGDGLPPWLPGPEELDTVREDFDIALSSDFRLMVHHFGLEVSTVFGREQMPRLGDDFDRIERRLMQVFGVNPSLLSAGASTQPYASSALQAEFLNQILRTFQQMLKKHFYERAAVVAEAQGHYDYEVKGTTRIPIYETIVEYDGEGNKTLKEVPKLLVPQLSFSTLDLRDEATERQYLQTLRGMGVPIPDEDLMVGVSWKIKDKIDTYNKELKEKTISQQQAKVDTYNALTIKGLPVPADLKAEVESVLGTQGNAVNSDDPMMGGGQGGPGAPGGDPGPSQSGGSPIVMPPPPAGLDDGGGDLGPGGQGGTPSGGGPPPTAPISPGPPGTVPDVSNERRPGLKYNTNVNEASADETSEEEPAILEKLEEIEDFKLAFNQELVEDDEGKEIIRQKSSKPRVISPEPSKKYSLIDPYAEPIEEELSEPESE